MMRCFVIPFLFCSSVRAADRPDFVVKFPKALMKMLSGMLNHYTRGRTLLDVESIAGR